jgi:predicted RNA-binding Zn-ribbon protein involved in translation (DUF1610 family)
MVHFFEWGWTQAKRVVAYVTRIAAMCSRMNALERAGGGHSWNTCPNCGENTMRKAKDSRILCTASHKWKEDVWTCQTCKQAQVRFVEL